MHTQGKWKVVSLEGFYFIETDDGVESGCYTHKADAERICKIKNSHDGLVEALKAFVAEYDNLPGGEAQSLIGRIQKLFTNARKAIAQAEE